MIDMTMKKTNAGNNEISEPISDENQPKYPWGLRIHLHTEEIEKLGLEMPNIGEEFILKAKVVVTELHESKSADNKDKKSIDFQITDMILKTEQDIINMAERLYKN